MPKPCASPEEVKEYIDEILEMCGNFPAHSSILSYDSQEGCEYCRPSKNNLYKIWSCQDGDKSRLYPPNLRFPSWSIITWNTVKSQFEDFCCEVEFCPKCGRDLHVN